MIINYFLKFLKNKKNINQNYIRKYCVYRNEFPIINNFYLFLIFFIIKCLDFIAAFIIL